MIRYRCAGCGAKLETDDQFGGKAEVCPSCRRTNPVPLSAATQAARAADASAARASKTANPRAKRRTAWALTEEALGIAGILMLFVGIVGAGIFFRGGSSAVMPEWVHDLYAGLALGWIIGAGLVSLACFAARRALIYLRQIAAASAKPEATE